MSKCRKCREELPEGARFCPKCGSKQDVAQKTKSRGNGTGSVYKLPNGTWIAVKVLGRVIDEEGRSHKQQVSKSGFKTKREAIEYLPMLTANTRAERERNISLRELWEKWEKTQTTTKSTMDCYRAAIKKFSSIWNMPVRQITVDDLQDCMEQIPGKRTQQNAKTVIGLLYKYAIPRHIAGLNMGQYLKVGGEEGLGKEGLPMDALEAIRKNVDKVPYADYVVAQCYLGFRPSEFLELDVSSYDRAKRTFTGGAKTEAGKNRVVPVSPKIQPIIDRLTADKIAGAVFCGADGGRMGIAEYRQRFYDVLDACGVENPVTEVNGVKRRRYTPHSARHTFATMLKDVKAADKDKLELIGHTSTEMLRHYQDVDVEALRRVVDAM